MNWRTELSLTGWGLWVEGFTSYGWRVEGCEGYPDSRQRWVMAYGWGETVGSLEDIWEWSSDQFQPTNEFAHFWKIPLWCLMPVRYLHHSGVYGWSSHSSIPAVGVSRHCGTAIFHLEFHLEHPRASADGQRLLLVIVFSCGNRWIYDLYNLTHIYIYVVMLGLMSALFPGCGSYPIIIIE